MEIQWDFDDMVTDFDKSILEEYDWILRNISTIEYLESSIVLLLPWRLRTSEALSLEQHGAIKM